MRNITSFGRISEGFIDVAETRVSRSLLKSTSESEWIFMSVREWMGVKRRSRPSLSVLLGTHVTVD